MTKRQRPDEKVATLSDQGVLNPRAEEVSDPLFLEQDFFDARDLVQVKYEMVRRVDAEGQTVTSAAAAFGCHFAGIARPGPRRFTREPRDQIDDLSGLADVVEQLQEQLR